MRCRHRWCQVAHKDPFDANHKGVIAEFAGLKVGLSLAERPGDMLDESWVQLDYSANGYRHHHDVTPQAAADWAEILAAVDVRELAAIAQALYQAGVTLGAST
ncbi:hypothetical protein AB0L53_54850 [Nonomuraea sp. NPDC052129]|uniref:hypothetical protein n=1 Tax=Nonomuraea sp. NPDC052129 TaxID=3154651 RepID=UPI003429BB1B